MSAKIVRFPVMRSVRMDHCLSEAQLAQQSGVPASVIHGYETGILDTKVYLDQFARVCKRLGLKIAQVLGEKP